MPRTTYVRVKVLIWVGCCTRQKTYLHVIHISEREQLVLVSCLVIARTIHVQWSDTSIQWNVFLETTAMIDHLSWKTTHFWQKELHFNWTCHQRPPVIRDHTFVAIGVVFQDRTYYIAVLRCHDVHRKQERPLENRGLPTNYTTRHAD